MSTPQAPRRGTRRRRKPRYPLPIASRRAALAIAATVGLALIVAITVHALLGTAGQPHGGKTAPTVTVTVPGHRVTVTVTVPRPGPTVTVTELRPGPTVTIRCQHPGRHCSRV